MHPPLYRTALRHSFRLSFRHKTLWLFGLFAGVLGQMGLMDFFLKLNAGSRDAVLVSGWWQFPSLLWESFRESGLALPLEGWIWLVWLGVVGLGLALFFVFTAVVSQGVLIHAAAQSVRHGRIQLGPAWLSGVRHTGRLFLLNLVRKGLVLALASALGWASFNALVRPDVFDKSVFVLLFFLAVAAGAAVSFLTLYAASYVVVGDYPFFRAIAAAWRLFTSHWVVSLEVAGLMLLAQAGAALAAALSAVFFFFPSIFVWGAAIAFASRTLFIAGSLLGTVIVLACILLISAFFTIFATAAWTYLFMKMHQEGMKSRVAHLFSP